MSLRQLGEQERITGSLQLSRLTRAPGTASGASRRASRQAITPPDSDGGGLALYAELGVASRRTLELDASLIRAASQFVAVAEARSLYQPDPGQPGPLPVSKPDHDRSGDAQMR